MSADQTPAPAAPSRRTLGVMLLLTVLSALLVLTAAGRTWAEGRAGTLDVSVTGGRISELPGGLALVGLAAAVAVFAVRGAGRLAVGALTLLAGRPPPRPPGRATPPRWTPRPPASSP